jgi:hypothetical protein
MTTEGTTTMSTFVKDWLERIVRTALVAFAVTFLAGLTTDIDLSALRALAISAAMAAGTAILGLLTKPVGNPDSASILPPPAS